MTAFVVVLRGGRLATGRDSFPTGATLAAASGAAFMAVVLAQTANAFACRSATRWPGALGWRTNRLLPPAIAIGLAFSLVVLLVRPIAHDWARPPPRSSGGSWRSTAAGVLLAVDAIDKQRRGRARRRRAEHS